MLMIPSWMLSSAGSVSLGISDGLWVLLQLLTDSVSPNSSAANSGFIVMILFGSFEVQKYDFIFTITHYLLIILVETAGAVFSMPFLLFGVDEIRLALGLECVCLVLPCGLDLFGCVAAFNHLSDAGRTYEQLKE